MIKNTDVALHNSTHEVHAFDPWSVIGAVRCPVLVLAGEDDPICPLPVVEELASQLPAETTRLVRLPRARHTIFRDPPDLAFPAVRHFVSQVIPEGADRCQVGVACSFAVVLGFAGHGGMASRLFSPDRCHLVRAGVRVKDRALGSGRACAAPQASLTRRLASR
jgi:hypothetical protein